MTKWAFPAFAAVMLLLPALPVPDFWITQSIYIGLYAIVALGLVLLTGVGGLTSFGFGPASAGLRKVRAGDLAHAEPQAGLTLDLGQFGNQPVTVLLNLPRGQHFGISGDGLNDDVEPGLFGMQPGDRGSALGLVNRRANPAAGVQRHLRRSLNGKRIDVVGRDPEETAIVDPPEPGSTLQPQQRVRFGAGPIQSCTRRRLAGLRFGKRGGACLGIGDGGGEVLSQCRGSQHGARQGNQGQVKAAHGGWIS